MAGEKKGLKLRRQSKGKVYYAAQFQRTEANRRKRMRSHLRSHPMDLKCEQHYLKTYGGRVSDFGMKARGERRAERWYRRDMQRERETAT
jgi:hypothetical protein